MEVAANEVAPSGIERRAYSRFDVKIYGRFMREDQTEYPCQVLDISPGNVSLRAESPGAPGEKVIAYLDHIGRLEGVVTRINSEDNMFAMTILATERKKDKLAAQLAWLANRQMSGMPEDRRHERIAPRNPVSVLHLMDGRKYECRIIDLSLSGAAIEINVKPALGAQVVLGTMRGEVVRHFDEGVAIEFAVVHSVDQLETEFNADAA
ncbi:MAG: PilZ domain-containing protein [Rhizobiaceae bacterium]